MLGGVVLGPGRNLIARMQDGPCPQQTLTPLPVGEDVGITFFDNNMPVGLGPFVFPCIITVELVFALNTCLKRPGSEECLVAWGNGDITVLSVLLMVILGEWQGCHRSH